MEWSLRRLANLEEFDWVRSGTLPRVDGEGTPVSWCIPPVFEAYVKIVHPIYEDPTGDPSTSLDQERREQEAEHPDEKPVQGSFEERLAHALEGAVLSSVGAVKNGEPTEGVRVRWRDLAARYGLAFHPEISVGSFKRKSGSSLPSNLRGPDTGILEAEQCAQLAHVLRTYEGGDDCYFEWFLMSDPEGKFVNSVYAGTISDILEAIRTGALYFPPTYWWPPSRRWLVCIDYDLPLTLVAGARVLIDEILRAPDLETIEVQPVHRIESEWDDVNT